MRLAALCICGALLALLSLSATIADPGEFLGDHGFGPCAATLRPDGPSRPGQDESVSPFVFSLPPLTLYLPKQLRELDKIVEDLQKLKDNVDQLRKMCADCTVSQTGNECGRQGEGEHVKLNEVTDRHRDEKNWLKERSSNDFSQGYETDSTEVEGNGDTDSQQIRILEEKGEKMWEVEKESDKGAVKETERENPRKEEEEKDGKNKKEGKDKLGQAKVQTSAGNEKIVDMIRKKVVEKNNRETDRNKDKDGKWSSKGDPDDTLENGKKSKSTGNGGKKEKTEESDHHMWRDERKETDKKTRTEEDRGSDGIKMSEAHDKHTNKQEGQDREERKKEMEKGIKVGRNNEKPKQTESIERAEKTIKVGEVEAGEMGTEGGTEGEKTVQSVQRDSDGEFASNRATVSTDLVSIGPTLHSIVSSAPRPDSMDSNKAGAFTSSFPPPPLSNCTSNMITDVNRGITKVVDELPTQSTGPGATGIFEHPSFDSEEGFRTTSRKTTTATTNTVSAASLQIIRDISRFTSTASARTEAGFRGRVSSTTATTATATPRQSLSTTTFPGVAERSRWTAKKNSSSNTKTGLKLLPVRGPKHGDRLKPVIMPEADQKPKHPKSDKPDRNPLPDKKPKHDQKQKPSNQKLKPGKDPKQVQIPKPDQRRPDHLPTDQNLKNDQIPKHDQEHTTDQSQLCIHQKPPPPVQRPTSHQRPQTVNATGSGPQTVGEPESVGISKINQNSNHDNKTVHPLKTNKPDQTEKPHKNLRSEEKTEPDQTPTIDQYFPSVQKPERGEKIPQINQRPKPDPKHPELLTDQATNAKAQPEPGRTAGTNRGLVSPRPEQTPDLKPKSVLDEIPEAESNKTFKPRPPPRRSPPIRATVRPGATPVQLQTTAVQRRPSPETNTDLGPLQSATTSDHFKHSETDMPPAPGSLTQTAEVSQSPRDAESSPSMIKTITLDPKISNRRIISDLRPQTAGRASIPTTTRPNKILPSGIPRTRPGSTTPNRASNTDSSLQAKTLHNVKEIEALTFADSDKIMIPAAAPSAQTTPTISPGLRSTTPSTSGPEAPAAESSTSSTRELRVKINQVEAFFNNRPPNRLPEDHPEDNPGGSKPDSKQSTRKPSKGKIYCIIHAIEAFNQV